MRALGKLLVENNGLRTTLYALVAVMLGICSSFMATEITDSSTNPATIQPNLIFQTIWFYGTILFFLANLFLSFSQKAALEDALRYNDVDFRRALVGKVAVDYFAQKIPDMVENGEIKSLEDALKLVEFDG